MVNFDKMKDAAGARYDSFELFYMKERSKRFESKEGDVCGVDLKEEEGIALRAIKGGKMVFGYTFDIENGWKGLLERSDSLLPHMEADSDRYFPGKYPLYPQMTIYDTKGLEADDKAKAGLAVELDRAIKGHDRRIAAARNCEFHEVEYEVKIENSMGLAVKGKKTLFSLSALCVARDEDEVSWYDWAWSNNLHDLDAQKLGNDIAKKGISMLSGKQIKTGVYAGILTPQASCDMLEILAGSFLAENLYKDKTYLKSKEGAQCFSEKLTIVDSGIKGMEAFPFDGEGVPSQNNTLVDGGYFRTFLYDSYYGRKYGVNSTGCSGRSGIKDLPACSTRGLFIESGARDISELADDCIVVEELMGIHTANPITGDFSLGALGFVMRNGKTTPFQGVILSGTVFEILKNVKEVGNDMRFYGSAGSPSLFVEGLKISGI